MVYIAEDEKLKLCLESLKKYSPDLEIDKIKIEPTEKTDALDEYNKYFESEKFVDDVIIWHPDMLATEGWYETLKTFYHCFDVVGCKMIYPNRLVQHYGGALRHDGVGCHPHQGLLNIGLNEPLSCAYVTGPSMVIKKKVYEKIGGFDSQFFKGYYGDVDFCFKAREAGFTVGVVPVTIVHAEGADALNIRPKWKTQELQIKHHLAFVTKWMPELAKYK